MLVAAELPLFASALSLAVVAIILALPRRRFRWRARLALAVGVLGVLIPLVAFPLRDLDLAAGRALWEWSAVGGPAVQASYRFDGVASIGVASVVGFAVAALLGVQRASLRHPLLPGLVLAIGLTSITVAVTDDLVAATVALGVLAALTAFAELLIAPAPASARLIAFYTIGIQSLAVAALLISRLGTGTFAFGDLRPTDISPGVVLAATLGAAIFAGLYPFVPWRFERPASGGAEREPLRGLIAMPAGICATLVLLRLLGTTRIELSLLQLPGVSEYPRAIAVAAVVGYWFFIRRRVGTIGRRRLVLGTAAIIVAAIYPLIHWSHLVLASAFLSVIYAAAVSLTRPDQWEVVRYDVALAALWVGLAIGTPTAVAGGLFLILAEAVNSMVGSIWLAPHRRYIAAVATATASLGSLLAIGAGIAGAADLPTQILAVLTLGSVLLLILIHVGRELGGAPLPSALEVTSGAAAFLGSTLLVILGAPALHSAAVQTFGRTLVPFPQSASFVVPALIVIGTLLVVVARTLRPFMPDLGEAASRLRTFAAIADPVPGAIASFRVLEAGATRAGLVFGAFEQRAGVWVATLLIFALLIWATR